MLIACKEEKAPVVNIKNGNDGQNVEWQMKQFISYNLNKEIGASGATYEPISWNFVSVENPYTPAQIVMVGPVRDINFIQNVYIYTNHTYRIKTSLEEREVTELYELRPKTNSIKKLKRAPWLDYM